MQRPPKFVVAWDHNIFEVKDTISIVRCGRGTQLYEVKLLFTETITELVRYYS